MQDFTWIRTVWFSCNISQDSYFSTKKNLEVKSICNVVLPIIMTWEFLVIDWLGLNDVFNNFSVIYGGQFTYTRISWFSHTSTPHNNLPKQLAAFPHILSQLVEDEWRMSHWLLSNVGFELTTPGLTARVATGARLNFLVKGQTSSIPKNQQHE